MTVPATLVRVERACAELAAGSLPVTFAAVAARAEVSRATLYRDESLRAVVEEHRQRNHDPRSLSGVLTEVRYLRTAVEELSDKVKQHEEKLRRLERARQAN